MDRNFNMKPQFVVVTENMALAKTEVASKWLDAVSEGVDGEWEAQYDNYFSAMQQNPKFVREPTAKGLAVFEDYFMRKLWTDLNAGVPDNTHRYATVRINSGPGATLAWAARAACIWEAT